MNFEEEQVQGEVIRDLTEHIIELENELASVKEKLQRAQIARDKEFWREYATASERELLLSNNKLQDAMFEREKRLAEAEQRVAAHKKVVDVNAEVYEQEKVRYRGRLAEAEAALTRQSLVYEIQIAEVELLLRQSVDSVCSLKCPGQWTTGSRPPHHELHRKIISYFSRVKALRPVKGQS